MMSICSVGAAAAVALGVEATHPPTPTRIKAAAAAANKVVLRIWVSPLREFSQRRHGTCRPYRADVTFHLSWYRVYRCRAGWNQGGRLCGIACSSLLQRSAHALLRGSGSSDGRWGFGQQWTTAAAAEPMRESPVRYFTPED